MIIFKDQIQFKSTMIFFKALTCLFLVSAFSTGLYAHQISGTVNNEQNGEAIEFANIVLTPGGYGTMTDQSGEFEIVKIPVGKYKLSISMLGFKTKSIYIEIESEQALHLKIGLLPERKESKAVFFHPRTKVSLPILFNKWNMAKRIS